MKIKETVDYIRGIRRNIQRDNSLCLEHNIEAIRQALNALSYAELFQLSKERWLTLYADPFVTESFQLGFVRKHHFQLIINDEVVVEIIRERVTMHSLVEQIKLEMLGTQSGYDPLVYYRVQTKIEDEKRQINREKLEVVRKLLRELRD